MRGWRRLFALGALLMLAGCVSGLGYGTVPHDTMSAGPLCNPQNSNEPPPIDAPYFAVTSRLPDCRSGKVKLTSYRAGALRYGRFALHPKNDERDQEADIALTLQAQQGWWRQLGQAARVHDGRVLLYIHGYRERFNRSARNTAQIQRLADFEGPVIHYSWPSIGELLSYTVDQTSVTWDVANFRRFLKKLAEQPWAKDIVIVSHSMGARLALPGVLYVDRTARPGDASNISKIILASPDADRQNFEQNIGRRILSPARVRAGRRMTIYLSGRDQALDVSRTLHGYPRLGRPHCFDPFRATNLRQRGLPERCYPKTFAGRAIAADSGLTIVDTTDVSVSSGHSNHLRSARVCADFATLLRGQKSTAKSRIATHLPHVFRLVPYGKGAEPDHDPLCMRYLPR